MQAIFLEGVLPSQHLTAKYLLSPKNTYSQNALKALFVIYVVLPPPTRAVKVRKPA
jgi:hypothetical protein